MNAAIGSATLAEIAAFAHVALFSPALSTLSTALTKGYLTNFSGLSLQLLCKHLPQSFAMVKGHLDQTQKNQCSTQPPDAPTPADTNDSSHPTHRNSTADPTSATQPSWNPLAKSKLIKQVTLSHHQAMATTTC